MNRPGETLLAFIERTILRRRPRPRVEPAPSLAFQEPSYVFSPYRVAFPRPPEPEPAEEPPRASNGASVEALLRSGAYWGEFCRQLGIETDSKVTLAGRFAYWDRYLKQLGVSSEEATRAFKQMRSDDTWACYRCGGRHSYRARACPVPKTSTGNPTEGGGSPA
jgi:hypothetical protein